MDPLVGNVYVLKPKDISADLKKKISLFQQEEGLTIVLKSHLPPLPRELIEKMKPIHIK